MTVSVKSSSMVCVCESICVCATLTNDHSWDENNLMGDGGPRPQQPQTTIGLPVQTEGQQIPSTTVSLETQQLEFEEGHNN